MNQPRKHHYNPRSILRRFSADEEGTQVYVFDKLTGKSFVSSIDDAGAERDFNTVQMDGSTICFEQLFDDIDGQLAHLADRLVREQTVACLDTAERRMLAEVVVAQVLRTKMPRTSMRSLTDQLAASLREVGFDPDEIQNFSIPTEQETRRAALATLLRPERLVASIEAKRTFMVRASGPEQFWTSDNPVALQQTYTYSELSLSAPGIEIYFPISRDLALAFYCPSIERQIGRALAQDHPQLDREKFSEIYRGLRTGTSVSLGKGTTRFLNELQVLRSSRFLYGPTADFELAHKAIARFPQARTIVSLAGVGKMGQGPPRRPGMPPGLCIVFFGREDHHVLHVEARKDEERGIMSVTTRDTATLQRIIEDQPLVQAILYQDGDELQGMRDVRVEVSEGELPVEVRVLHQDEALNQLMRLIDTRSPRS